MADFDYDHVRVNGADSLIARLKMLPQYATEGMVKAMGDMTGEMMKDAKENYVPFRLGDLRGSGTVYIEKGVVYATFGYPGSGAEEYAVEQHENLSYSHEPPEHMGGQAKYLELPLHMWEQRILEAAASSLDITLEVISGFGTELRQISSWTEEPIIIVAPEPVIKKPFSAAPRLVKKAK